MSEQKNGSSTEVESSKPTSRITADGAAQETVMPETPPAVPGALEYDYTNFYFGAGEDAFALLGPFDDWWNEVKPAGYYLYELPLHSAPSTRVDVEDTKTHEVRKGLINFASYNYLGLSYRPEVKEAIKEADDVYGGGASGSPILSGTTDLHRGSPEHVKPRGTKREERERRLHGWGLDLHVFPFLAPVSRV